MLEKHINLARSLFTTLILIIILSLMLTACCYFPFDIRSKSSEKEDSENYEQSIKEEDFEGIPNSLLLSDLKISGQAIDLDVSGNYAYVTNDLGILYVVDIENKKDPFIVGKCCGVDSANIVIVQDDYAYISYTDFINNEEVYTNCGFYVVNIEKKDNPELVGNYNTGEHNRKSVYGLFIEDNYAYINTSIEGEDFDASSFEIIDISNKVLPELVCSYELEGIPSNIWIEDDTAYININFYDYEKNEYTENSSLTIIDIKEKENPIILSSSRILSRAWGIYLLDNYIYVSTCRMDEESDKYTDSLIQAVNIEDPYNPEAYGNCKIPGGAWELGTAGGFIYVSSLSGGIYAVDISDNNNPVIIDNLKTGGSSYDITTAGNNGYIADGFEGLAIISLSEKYSSKENLYTGNNDENYAPQAVLEIFGDTLGDKNFYTQNPVYFSAEKSYDYDDDDINYKWMVNGNEYSGESSFSYYFKEDGEYEIKLIVTDGTESSEAIETITITDKKQPVEIVKKHNFIVEIEYKLINNGPGDLDDIKCLMRIPQTYYPFQVINGYTPNIGKTTEVFDNNWNLFANFKFDRELPEGESLNASVKVDVTSVEFNYLDFDSYNLTYSKNDEDLIEYTADDLFIDSDNPIINDTAKSLIKDELMPLKIAEIIYHFVVRKLHYDYPRAEERDYEFLYASEILERGKGVCADYAILYTALLRAAGIPARLAAGIPVYTILYEKSKEIDIGHAWVEIKLPLYGWIPIDITVEDNFMSKNYYFDVTTERGPGYLYENTTMDISSYYYDGFKFDWDGPEMPDIEQEFLFKVINLDLEEIVLD